MFFLFLPEIHANGLHWKQVETLCIKCQNHFSGKNKKYFKIHVKKHVVGPQQDTSNDIGLDKSGYQVNSFLTSQQKVCSGYSLEVVRCF